jgi:hypothetical protein
MDAKNIIRAKFRHRREILCWLHELAKASVSVKWTKLMQILKETGIDRREKKIFISILYMDHGVKVRLDRGVTRSVKVGSRVRHGCCLSPIVFNLYNEYLTKKDLEGSADFKIEEQILCNVKYADELVLLAKEEMVLQETL